MKRIYTRGPIAVRFWAHVAKGDGCWEYTGARGTFGYGNVNIGASRYDRAHRVSWRLTHGAIPGGMQVLHRCDNPPCVRPDHLFLGTPSDNVRDMMGKARGGGQFAAPAHCKHGHEFTEANTERRADGNRRCRQCRRLASKRRRAHFGTCPDAAVFHWTRL